MSNPKFAVEKVIDQVKLLRLEFPQLNDDEELLADTVEGETDLHSVLDRLLSQVREHDALGEAIAARVAKLRERQTRMTMRMNFYRSLIQRLMEASGVRSVNLVEGKISVVNSPEKVIITDEAAIPDEFMRVKKEPDKTAIKRALNNGNHVSGASLSNGGTTITIR